MPKGVTESTNETVIELFILKSYLFSFFITAHYHCLELILMYYHIIHFKPINDLLPFSNTFMSSSILFLAAYIV